MLGLKKEKRKMIKNEILFWIWIVIIILSVLLVVLFIRSYNSISYEDYVTLLDDYSSCFSDSVDESINYLELLDCYQKAEPTCDAQIEKFGEASVFTLGVNG